jgi:hypothetical protein
MEEWRPVVEWEGLYEVSSHGRVRSLGRVVTAVGREKTHLRRIPPRLLTAWIASHGYFMVCLGGRKCKGGTHELVHRLVCRAFHGPAPEGHEVCHGPGGKRDNTASNLSWGSKSKNRNEDRVRDGTLIDGVRHYNALLSTEEVLQIWSRKAESSAEVASCYVVNSRTIRDIWNRKTWKSVSNTL